MKREFTFISKHGNGRRKLVVATIAILLLVGVDMLSGGVVRSGARAVAVKIWSVSDYARNSIFGSGYFVSHAKLASENAALRDSLSQFQQEGAGYRVVKQENDELRSMLHLAQEEKGITAPIVSSVIASPYGTFLVGAGSADEVLVGSLVVTDGGFVVGTVSELGTYTSVVTELFAVGASIDVRIAGAPTTASGRGGSNARATLPRGITVSIGDPVTAPVFGGRAVGIVGQVDSDPAKAEQTIYIHLPVNLGSLHYVYLVPST